MSGAPRNFAASIRQRLLNLSRERNEDFGFLLTLYGLVGTEVPFTMRWRASGPWVPP